MSPKSAQLWHLVWRNREFKRSGVYALGVVLLCLGSAFALTHISISSSLPSASLSQPYSANIGISGGSAPFQFVISAGTLPPGLSLAGSTGTISGTPTQTGKFSFHVGVTGSGGAAHGDSWLAITVASGGAISVTVSPASVSLNSGASQQFTAYVTGTSNTAVTWSASHGTVSTSGLFQAPSVTTATAMTVTATSVADSSKKASAAVTVTPTSGLIITTTSLPGGDTATPYSGALSAAGGTPPYAWSISSGALPAGITLATSTGLLSGTPTTQGTYSFTAKVTDAHGGTATQPLAISVTSGSGGTFDGPAELPRVYVQSSMSNTPAPGATINLPAGGDFQAAVNAANCGDTIQLQAGATFTGNYLLPTKSCDDNHWIVIRSSASTLPPEGTRISPCYAGVTSLPGRPALNCSSAQKVMATLMGVKGGGPIRLAPGANHYRIGPGLELTRPAGTGINFGLVLRNDPTAPSDHIILDRDWVHGSARDDTTRGMHLNGLTYVAVVDSYFNDFHCAAIIGTCIDSQAIGGGSGYLPMGTWKIVNNFLEGSAENLMFGGAPGSTTPTDIEVRHNHMFKPLTWMPGQPGFVGAVNTNPAKCTQFHTPGYCPFIVKNLFELKNAQRLLFEGNVMEYSWAGFTQPGAAILLTALSQGGTTGNPNATVADITIRYNRIAHTASGMVIGESAYQWGPAKMEGRISIHDDIFDDMSPFYNNNDPMGVQVAFQIGYCSVCTPLQNVSINHLTMLMSSPRMLMNIGAPIGAPIQAMTFTNSIISTVGGLAVNGSGANIPCGFSGSTNLARIANCVNPYVMTANVLIGANGTWPAGNQFPASPTNVGFVNYNAGNGGDYHLLPSSSYANAASDGTDIGANVNNVNSATATSW